MLIYSTYIYCLTGNPCSGRLQNAAWGAANVGLARFLAGERTSVAEQGGYTTTRRRNVLDFLNILAAGARRRQPLAGRTGASGWRLRGLAGR